MTESPGTRSSGTNLSNFQWTQMEGEFLGEVKGPILRSWETRLGQVACYAMYMNWDETCMSGPRCRPKRGTKSKVWLFEDKSRTDLLISECRAMENLIGKGYGPSWTVGPKLRACHYQGQFLDRLVHPSMHSNWIGRSQASSQRESQWVSNRLCIGTFGTILRVLRNPGIKMMLCWRGRHEQSFTRNKTFVNYLFISISGTQSKQLITRGWSFDISRSQAQEPRRGCSPRQSYFFSKIIILYRLFCPRLLVKSIKVQLSFEGS